MPRKAIPPRSNLLLIVSWAAGGGAAFDPSTVPWSAVLPERFARPAWNPERSELTRAGWTQSLWAVPPAKIPEPVLPERRLAPWNPERTETARAGWTQATWAVPPTKIPEPVLPESFARPAWKPERTETARASWTQSLWAVPPTKTPDPVLPDLFLRPVWNPERSDSARAGWTQALWSIPPTKPPDPCLPEFFARPGWFPDRGQTLWNPFQFAAVVVPTWGYEFQGPHAFLRPLWNPERTELARAAWTQALWAVAPTKIPEPVLPTSFARPIWAPERSHLVGQQFILPVPGATVLLPERYPYPDRLERTFLVGQPLVLPRPGAVALSPESYLRPIWVPERTALVIAPRQAPAPLLSWRPELLERFIQPWRPPPSLESWLPPFPIPFKATVVPLYFLRGLLDDYELTGQQDLYVLRGALDTYAIPGSSMPLAASLSVPLGDDAPIALTLLKPDGTAFDLTGCTVLFSVKVNPQDTVFVLQKSSATGGVVITNGPAGLATVTLNAADTASLTEATYQMDVQVTDAATKKHTLIKGTLTLTQHPSR